MKIATALCAAIIVFGSCVASGVPFQQETAAGTNENFYKVAGSPIRLEADSVSRLGLREHLEALALQEENCLTVNNLFGPSTTRSYWLGGFRLVGAGEPTAGLITEKTSAFGHWELIRAETK